MADKQLDFLKKYPKGIYRIQFLCTLDGEKLDPEDKAKFEKNLSYIHSNPERRYVQTPQEFFQAWLNGRLDKTPNLDNTCKGFELQLPNVRIQRFDDGGVFGRVEGLVIASDFGNDIVFAINDIPNKRVLTYHDEKGKEIKRNPLGRKELTAKPIYRFGNQPEKYPFESLNPLKSANYTWSLVNVSQDEVYQALREIGFKW
ncbi:hypothetical protein DRH29_03620 [candidate division Kazan bacterium]|uniref:Uncharacterized protein n=1 Tax=candidate division Kazan bacterium TaxID=2202143 RepID=A0A420ZCA4_UNCK3|nr:MAG: hypothetical protein DRH29_03620 [candidate division Kazan bacterium]